MVIASLTELNLSQNQLFPNGEVPSSKLIGESFAAGAKVRIKEGYEGELMVLREANADGNVLLGDPSGIQAIADALRVTASLTVTDMRYNNLETESATMLATVAKEKGISLCGIKPDQTEANLQGSPGRRMGPTDAILLTADLAVRPSLTRLDVKHNPLGEEGEAALRKASEGRSGFKLLL